MDLPKIEWVPIEDPYDDYELEMLRRIDALKRSYEAMAKPYLDELVRSRSMKSKHGYFQVDAQSRVEQIEALRDVVRCGTGLLLDGKHIPAEQMYKTDAPTLNEP